MGGTTEVDGEGWTMELATPAIKNGTRDGIK